MKLWKWLYQKLQMSVQPNLSEIESLRDEIIKLKQQQNSLKKVYNLNMIEKFFNFRGIGIEIEKYTEIKKYGNKIKMELSDHRTKE